MLDRMIKLAIVVSINTECSDDSSRRHSEKGTERYGRLQYNDRILAGRRRSGTFEFRSLYVRLRAERARKNQTI